MLRAVKETASVLDKRIKNRLASDIKNKYVPQIQELLLNEYDSKLIGVVRDRSSKTNPVYYKEDFIAAVKNFQYLPTPSFSEEITVRVPDMTNFPFSYKRLSVIQNILEGVVGSYVEVTEEQYVAMFSRRPVSDAPYDKTVPPKERIYLLKYTSDIQKREINAFKRKVLTHYPFSNTPPINIFGAANEFVSRNLSQWVETAVQESMEDIE